MTSYRIATKLLVDIFPSYFQIVTTFLMLVKQILTQKFLFKNILLLKYNIIRYFRQRIKNLFGLWALSFN